MDLKSYQKEARELGLLLGRRIKEARVREGMTQQVLSEELGLASVGTMVSQLEHGRRMPRDGLLKRVCQVLSLNYDELIEIRDQVNGLRKIARLLATHNTPVVQEYVAQTDISGKRLQLESVEEIIGRLRHPYLEHVAQTARLLIRLQESEEK